MAKFYWLSVRSMRISQACGSLPAVRLSWESQPDALARELREELGIEAVVGRYIASHQREVSGRLIHLHAWHVPSYQGELKAYEHQDIVWCSPEEALRYPLAPADIPLLEAFILLRDARPADSC